MPKQIFQRPVRVPVQRNPKIKSGIPGQLDYGRKNKKPVPPKQAAAKTQKP